MRFVLTALLLIAGHASIAQAQPSPTPAPEPNRNVVVLSTAPPWWGNAEFDRKVTLVINSVDLDAAIDALGRAANISLVASGGSKARKKVTLNLRDAPLRDVMLAVADLYGLTWFRTGEVYTLTYISTAKKSGSSPSTSFKLPAPRPLKPLPIYRPRTYKPRTYRRTTLP